MIFESFIQAFEARLVPVVHEVVPGAMLHFHPERYPFYAAVAGLGALAASALVYGIGRWLRRMPARVSSAEQQAKIQAMRHTALRWLPWLLILAPTPVGGTLILAAGFFGVRPWRAAGMVVVAEVIWRISPML